MYFSDRHRERVLARRKRFNSKLIPVEVLSLIGILVAFLIAKN